MGYSASWFAVRGTTKAAVLQGLGFQEAEELEHPFDAPYGLLSLPGGWRVVVARDMDWAARHDWSAFVPSATETFNCEATTVVMFSRAWSNKNGGLLWNVVHDPEAEEDLKVEGAPPAALAGIYKDLAAEQAADEEGGVDYVFDVPINLSAALCGFAPEEELPAGAVVTKLVLLPGSLSAPPARPLSLFGRLKRVLFG